MYDWCRIADEVRDADSSAAVCAWWHLRIQVGVLWYRIRRLRELCCCYRVGPFVGKSVIRNLLTYLLTPYSTVLLEQLTGSAGSQEIPRIFGTRRFVTVLTSARHLSLS